MIFVSRFKQESAYSDGTMSSSEIGSMAGHRLRLDIRAGHADAPQAYKATRSRDYGIAVRWDGVQRHPVADVSMAIRGTLPDVATVRALLLDAVQAVLGDDGGGEP